VSGYEIVQNSTTFAIPPQEGPRPVDVTATCPSGKKAIGGSGTVNIDFDPSGSNYAGFLLGSEPVNSGAGWQATGGYSIGTNGPGASLRVTAFAVCAVVG
jgi:hypothetical protein